MSLTLLDLRGIPSAGVAAALPARAEDELFPTEAVAAILAQVRKEGDAALLALTRQFDGVEMDSLVVSRTEIDGALDRITPALRSALELAHSRVEAYHRHGLTEVPDFELGGIKVSHLVRPVARAGLYAPGGRARYPSTVIMTAVPAKVAGVAQVVLTVPPSPDGHIADETLAAAAIAGVDEVYAVGGAQAIGALAFGTASIAAVDVIAGPGNRYVAEAKRQVAGRVGVPSAYAGPSEVVVVADDSAPADWVAADIVLQAEHGPDGLAWLVTWSAATAQAVSAEVERLVAESPRRSDLEQTLGSGGYTVLVDNPECAMAVVNEVAPEHLELMCHDPHGLLELVRSAGAVFLGSYAPAAVGDYLAGPNHVLPTARSAKFSSALKVDDFRTSIHVVDMDREALARVAPAVITLAEAEGLAAHAMAVSMRCAPPTVSDLGTRRVR